MLETRIETSVSYQLLHLLFELVSGLVNTHFCCCDPNHHATISSLRPLSDFTMSPYVVKDSC
jgi:hypothetical protein